MWRQSQEKPGSSGSARLSTAYWSPGQSYRTNSSYSVSSAPSSTAQRCSPASSRLCSFLWLRCSPSCSFTSHSMSPRVLPLRCPSGASSPTYTERFGPRHKGPTNLSTRSIWTLRRFTHVFVYDVHFPWQLVFTLEKISSQQISYCMTSWRKFIEQMLTKHVRQIAERSS